MRWPGEIVEATFLKRYKRFLADFRLADGSIVTAHCANTGSMKTCIQAEAPAWLTFHDDPKRKLKYSWQAIQMPDGWVGINTSLANGLVIEAIQNGVIEELAGYEQLRPEKQVHKGTRLDGLLQKDGRPDCYFEVKNVTLLQAPKIASFPDAVTLRGQKHLHTLSELVSQGRRAALVFCVQRLSCEKMVPADQFDPEYGRLIRQFAKEGVEILAYRTTMDQSGVNLTTRIPVEW